MALAPLASTADSEPGVSSSQPSNMILLVTKSKVPVAFSGPKVSAYQRGRKPTLRIEVIMLVMYKA